MNAKRYAVLSLAMVVALLIAGVLSKVFGG